MSDAQIPVLNVTVIDYKPGSTNDYEPVKYVKLGKNGQFKWDEQLTDTKKDFKEKYKFADLAITLYEQNRVTQVNKTGTGAINLGVKSDPDSVIPIIPSSSIQSPQFIYQIIPPMPVRKAYSPILPRPTNDPRTANGQTILLSPRSDSISSGFSGALLTGKPSPKPIAPKIHHSTTSRQQQNIQVFQTKMQDKADSMSQSSEISTNIDEMKTEEKEDECQNQTEEVETDRDAIEDMKREKEDKVIIPQDIKHDADRCQKPSDNLHFLLNLCDSYVCDDITLGEEQATPENELQIPQETPVVEVQAPEVAPNMSASQKAPEVQKKKRGRPKGSTKKKMEERKKESEAKGVKRSQKKKPEPKKKTRGRPPKAKPPGKTGKNKPKPFPMPLLELDSSSSSSGSETESSEPESTDSSEDEGQRTSKIKMPGESLDKIKKPSSAAKSKSSPKLETESPVNVESPQKEQPRKSSLTKEPPSLNKMLRKPSLTKSTLPNRQEPSKKSTPGLPVINDRIKFMKMFEQLQHEKLEPTGYIPGRLVQELEDAVNKGTINDFGRKLVGMKSLNPDAGKFTISEEVNGKLGDSALCKAASVRVDKGGPSLITSLVHIAGADTHQTNSSGNTALHIAAEAGIPGNVATLLSYKSPINVRNNKKETALLLAVRRATKFEKLYHKNMNSSVLAIEFKMQWSDAFRCVEMLLSAGGNIDKMTLQAAETSSAADLLYLYHYTVIENVYKFVKSTLGKANLTVHDRLLYSATIVPRDQNIFEFTLDPVEFLRPGMFLTLFAVHGRHEGFSSDFEKLQDLRLSGNPCLLSEAKWLSHSPDLYPKKPSILSLEGFPSWSLMGPFEPGKDLEKYEERVENQHFVTFLNYTPFRENRYTLSIVPAHWTEELLFICVYPSEIQISNATFQKGAPEILRQKERAFRNWEIAREKARQAKLQWEREFPGEECEILRRGVNVNSLKH